MAQELTISQSEHKVRIEKIRERLKRSRIDALYLTNPTRILYATGFAHITTERPIAVVIPQENPVFFMGPHLEEDHVKQGAPLIEEAHTYPDYPGNVHPMRTFVKVLAQKKLGAGSKIATDTLQGSAGGWGYRGTPLTELMQQTKFTDGSEIVDKMREIKSLQEIRLLRESAKWSQIAHDFLMEIIKPGIADVLVGLKASYEALEQMLKRLGKNYRQLKWGLSPVVVGFRGQVGPDSAIPHSVYSKRKIRKGDVLVTEAGVEIGGYTSELERTVVVGRASTKAKRYFEEMLRAQSAALVEFREGAPCGRPDEAANKSVREAGLGECLRHHTGHGIGLDGHEPPWLDPGDRTIMDAGMVFSCEPGIYVPGFAGFRHSDTILVTKKGKDFITKYPRDIEDLTV